MLGQQEGWAWPGLTESALDSAPYKTVGENVEKLQPLCTVGRNAHGAAAGDSSVAVSQKIRNTTAM